MSDRVQNQRAVVSRKDKTNGHSSASNSGARRFGTFGGVFTPNVLTILGVILFLRAGWVVGNVGLWGAVSIIIIANLISLSTGLSLSSIATSMDVGGGGNYYMISRTLGLEIGGSIGIPLYISQALSLAFYTIGFAEGLRWIFPEYDLVLVASIACILLTAISLVGADMAIKVQYFILAVLGLSLLSFFTGSTPSQHAISSWGDGAGVGFWTAFAIYFPAVTGIEVGVSMSGDLKDPQHSIPRGTLWAIGITTFIYLAQAVWLAHNVSMIDLRENLMAMKSVARWPWAITAGLWAATISSALGCIIAAPRTLQALAKDNILPKFIGKGAPKTNEPRLAIIITLILAEGCILAGGLDVVAPVISMFFLNTYGVINLVAALERLIGNPSYRPKFKTHWGISLLGAIGCYITMFLINPLATAFALVITFGIFYYLSQKEYAVAWGDVRSGFWYSLARLIIFKLERYEKHPLNWRPNIMVFSGNPYTRKELIEFANWLGEGKGIITFYQLLVGLKNNAVVHRNAALESLKTFIKENNLQALGKVCLADNFREGIKDIAQAHGVGYIQSNIVLMGWVH